MTFLTNYSGIRYFPILLLVYVLLSGCAAAPVTERADQPPPLTIDSLSPDKASPQQAAGMAAVRWTAAATGGVGARTYTFVVSDGREERREGVAWARQGVHPSWKWHPAEAGTYKVKVVVEDSAGNRAESGWSPEYVIFPKLSVSSITPDKASPQAAGMAEIRWTSVATGGVGARTYTFVVSDGREERREGLAWARQDVFPSWKWHPAEAGTYKLKVVVEDSAGNRAESGWSAEYVIFPKLSVSSITPDKASPQAAGITEVHWKADVAGGVGEREYRFWIAGESGEKEEQKGLEPAWEWHPRDPGIYRVKVVVKDAVGNTVDSGWSPEYRITRTAGMQSLITLMPVVNLSGMPIPIKVLRESLVETMKRKGLNILDEDAQEKFLERHRVRYTGGLSGELGEALREETGANVVLFISLEMFEEAVPPKVALIARLVSTNRKAGILWSDSVGMAGNDAPGFLLLGLINDPRVLWNKAKEEILASLIAYLSGEEAQGTRKVEKRFLPKIYHGVSPKTPPGKEIFSVAVLPFRNESTRRNAGEIMALHFVRELSNMGTVEVIEPGVVRQSLLRTRMIMVEGLSLPQADILRAELNVDLVLTGIVMEYQDSIGGGNNPKVEFSTRVFDMKTRQIIWSSSSYNEGDDGVFFFNLGKVNTANKMTTGMVRSVVERMNAVILGRNGQLAATVSPGPRP